ncbi:CoA ester lyase [Polaromonas sp.]|uniref:HpcH/HpaI aldolase/citrate lyase family protein n=1 Tax=Polaromonas sp. TaxID=1869339 RepID=UPI00286B22E2|nr:CoA ester lyase [Polaromonas sp.]
MADYAPLTYLFVPGNRPERFARALASGAERVIIDLEDAVAPADKAAARAAIAQWMAGASEARKNLLLRINDAATDWHDQDLALARAVRAACLMLPKCEAPDQVAAVRAGLPKDASVLPLIETARGMVALYEIAAAPGVTRLAFGSLDYMADLDLPAGSLALDYAAAQIVVASRAAGLPAPVAGVTPELDAARVAADMAHARSLGFGAKMCVHPSQVAVVRAALRPSAEELAWAQRVLHAWKASTGGALQLDGKMVDRPVVLKAERIAAQAARTK